MWQVCCFGKGQWFVFVYYLWVLVKFLIGVLGLKKVVVLGSGLILLCQQSCVSLRCWVQVWKIFRSLFLGVFLNSIMIFWIIFFWFLGLKGLLGQSQVWDWLKSVLVQFWMAFFWLDVVVLVVLLFVLVIFFVLAVAFFFGFCFFCVGICLFWLFLFMGFCKFFIRGFCFLLFIVFVLVFVRVYVFVGGKIFLKLKYFGRL